MMTLFAPYSIPVEELAGGLSDIGFNIRDYFSNSAIYRFSNILVFTGDSLYSVKYTGITPYTMFHVYEGMEEIQAIDEERIGNGDSIILSTVSPFVWDMGKCHEPYNPKKGDSFLKVSTKSMRDVDAMILSIGLHFSLCVDLDMRVSGNGDTKDFTFIISKTANRKRALDIFAKHEKEMKKIYEFESFQLVRRYVPPFKGVDDFKEDEEVG